MKKSSLEQIPAVVASVSPSILDSEWLTMTEIMKVLDKSRSSVERLAAAGVIATRVEPRPHRKPERMYSATDGKKVAANERETGVPLRFAKPPVSTQLAIPMEAISSLRDVTTGLGNAATSSLRELMKEWQNMPDRIGPREKLWLTIDEAVELSGRSCAWLLRACREGLITAEKDSGWKILRHSLEAFTGESTRNSKLLRHVAAAK